MTAARSTPSTTVPPTNRGSRKLGVLPFIRLILFAVSAIPILRDPGRTRQQELLQNGVVSSTVLVIDFGVPLLLGLAYLAWV